MFIAPAAASSFMQAVYGAFWTRVREEAIRRDTNCPKRAFDVLGKSPVSLVTNGSTVAETSEARSAARRREERIAACKSMCLKRIEEGNVAQTEADEYEANGAKAFIRYPVP